MRDALKTVNDPAISLAGIRLLRHLRRDERDTLATQCTYRRFVGGQVILDRFSSSAGVFFLISGAARVVHVVASGDEITIATITAGDTIGEISAIDGQGRSATVVAEEECVVAELPRAEFHALLSRCGDVALDLLCRWAVTIRQLSDKVSYLATGSPDQRVCSELLRLARPDESGSSHWLIRELPSHQDLAKWAQTSREIVAGVVAELLRRGIAVRRTRTLHILDHGALKSLAAGTGHTDNSPAPRRTAGASAG